MSLQLPTSAYEFLRNRILSGQLPPNSRIVEKEVAGQLKISRTPVREALARLEMEGLVARSPRRGATVCPMELDEVDEIYEIRAALETLVARRACARATDAEIETLACALRQAQECLQMEDLVGTSRNTVHFHYLLNRSSRSPRLVDLLRSLEDRLTSFRYKGLRYPNHIQTTMRLHLEILESLKRRDVSKMIRLIEEHAEEGRATAIKVHLEEAQNRRMGAQIGI